MDCLLLVYVAASTPTTRLLLSGRERRTSRSRREQISLSSSLTFLLVSLFLLADIFRRHYLLLSVSIRKKRHADSSFSFSPPSVASLPDLEPSVLTTLENLPIEGSKACFLDLSKILIEQTPSTKVVHESYETAEKRFKEEGDFIAFLKVLWDQGGLRSAAKDEDLKNDLWPEWKPTRVEEFLKEGAQKLGLDFDVTAMQ